MKNNSSELKEQRKHGPEAMPIKAYTYNAPYGVVPVHCHWHDEMELFLVTKGVARVQCENSFFTAKPGTLFFFSSGELHSAVSGDGGEIGFESIVFHPAILCDSGIIRAKYINPIVSEKIKVPNIIDFDTEINEKFCQLYQLLRESSGFAYELKVKALLFDIFYALSPHFTEVGEKSGKTGEAMKKAMQYIGENYTSEISTAKLCGIATMSEGHFCRTFKEYTLKTPVEYINSLRVARAMELLNSTDMKIVDVAMETGFNNQSYFIGVFSKFVGTTPAKFRKTEKR